ncbi:glycosyltransferase family 2 protein [Vibrio fluvialis]|uniref:glycosyltransferase family 2 protein n=1 Tax=Vibrio fluvialis TaxID=676 RepID=UPI001F1C93D2|nr:glycosyltransferase family 2 protein [Vibrio fluvialis]MCE7595916.1 glycosyltransferase family 2 protein [Vibrio fluvialis]
MGNIKLSIIIPCYNVSRYLPFLLEGIINQLRGEVEVILVDDCSSDNTLDVIQEYVGKSEQLVLVKNETNEGISSSRNKALSISRGDYLWFIDSDDLIEDGAINEIMREISGSSEYDIINFSHTITKTQENTSMNIYPPQGEYDKDGFFKLALKKKFSFHLWNKIISKKIVGNSKADQDITILVDMNFLLNVIRDKDIKIKSSSVIIYNYFLRPGTTITKINSRKLKDQQYTFGKYMSDIKSLNDPTLDGFIIKEKVNTSYQIVKNKGRLIENWISFKHFFCRSLTLKERYKALYVVFCGSVE